MARAAIDRRLAALLLALVVAAGCSSTSDATESGYCKLMEQHLTELATPAIGDDAAVTSMVRLYQQITAASPLAIQPEWRTMQSSVEVAAKVDPADPASVQAAADAARESQVAANRVIDYTQQHCHLTLGLPGNTVATTVAGSVPGTT